MEVVYLGGAGEVGASSILLKIDGKNILLDSGIRQNKNKDKLPDFNLITSFGGLDAIIISHAHMDHIGSLPLISKEYPKANIYMNQMSLDLTRVLLYDSLKIMNYNEGEIPIFNEEDVLNMLDRVKIVPYQKEVEICSSIHLTFYMAGHIAGASCAYLKTNEGSVFYTGDFSLTNAHTINGMSIPKLRPDVIISETTYGDKLHSNREVEEQRLVEKVSQILSNKGKILIPVFALGRSQEVLLILKKAINKKQLPNTPIYVDGMVQNINAVFEKNPLYLKESLGKKILREKEIFYDKNVCRVLDDKMRQKIVEDNTPSIIVSSSGMLMGGRSEYYASKLVENSNNAILLTGYQDEESNGRILLNLMNEEKEKRKLKLDGKVYSVNCEVDIIGLSAHADKQEIKNVITMLKPKNIILGHGEANVISSFAKDLQTSINASIYVPNIGECLKIEVRNPRKQIDKKIEFLYSQDGSMKDFYQFIKEHYQNRLFTKEDLSYIYYGKDISEEEILTFTKQLIESVYFTQDSHRYFLFKIADELDIIQNEKKEVTNQDLEERLVDMIKSYPYKKISFYRPEKKIVVTFDFPRVIDHSFEKICTDFYNSTGFQVEKNNNINNLACEMVIKEEVGCENIDKISYLPLEDKFKVKVFKEINCIDKIRKRIGYDIEFILTEKKKEISINKMIKGEKMEQNAAMLYIDQFFSSKDQKPYKKSLKNGNIVLSFITYEIGLKYKEELTKLEETIGYNIELNKNANMSLIFSELNSLLNKFDICKIKNPSYLPNENRVSIKIEKCDDNKINALKQEFYNMVGLELKIEI